MHFHRLIAFRFMLKSTERGRFSLMTLFAWLAIGVGVGAMGCLLSVMYGFETTLRERVLKAYPHLIIKGKDGAISDEHEKLTEEIMKFENVRLAYPFIESEMIIQSRKRTLGAVVRGIPNFELIRDGISEGDLPKPTDVYKVIIGSELADRLSVRLNEKIKVISPIETSGPMGLLPRSRTYEVVGFYTSGHYDFDQQYIFLNLEDAKELLKMHHSFSGWFVFCHLLDDTQSLETELASILPKNVEIQSWKVFNSALFQSLKLEQYAMFVILSFAVLIAVMNIVITLMMNVTHKRKNIGILRALGASVKLVRSIYVWQGLFLGAVGLLIGAGLTLAVLTYLQYFSGYQLPEIYYDRSIPIEIRPLSFLLIYGVATLLVLLATLLPAREAAKLDPIQAIRE